MQTSEFIAWSIYTGPMEVHTVIADPACPWITGRWSSNSGIISTPAEIQKDIDQRITLVIDAFKQANKKYTANRRYFAIPEFFFRCSEGPYPNVLLIYKAQRLAPFEYIKQKIEDSIELLSASSNETYIICLGSVLTCNIEDYAAFFSSHTVMRRQEELQEKLSNIIKQTPIGDKRIRQLFNNPDKNSVSLQQVNNVMQGYRGDPLCTVRNRGIMLVSTKGSLKSYIYEKQAESMVDLTMGVFNKGKIEHGNMITEWMANCPSYSIINGDIQTNKESTNARICSELDGKNYGVEICLDHRLQRLCRTVGMLEKNGADRDIPPLDVQIICSGGMQLLDYGIAVAAEMPIFNADGCDKIYKEYGKNHNIFNAGEPGTGIGEYCGVFALNGQSKWLGFDGASYYSHSQLAYSVESSEIVGYNNTLGINNPKVSTVSDKVNVNGYSRILDYNIQTEVLNAELRARFVVDKSELHYYLLKNEKIS